METHKPRTATINDFREWDQRNELILAPEFQRRKVWDRLKAAVAALSGATPYEEIGNKLGEELHSFILKDSKVPDMVIEGVGKFIDFKKYLGIAAEKGAQEATKHAELTLTEAMEVSQE